MSALAPLAAGPGRAPLERLFASPTNPRTITRADLDRLKHTLRGRPDMLYARPLIVVQDGEVLAGNQRHTALVELQAEYVESPYEGTLAEIFEEGAPIHVLVDPSDEERREVMLLDNQAFGRWDDEKLAAIVAQHAADDADLTMLGFADSELASLARIAHRVEVDQHTRGHGEADAEPPPRPAEPTSIPGQVYRLGPHVLAVGDSRSSALVDAAFAAAGVDGADLVVTDPPYGIGYQRTPGTHPHEDASPEEWDAYRAKQAEVADKLRRRKDVDTLSIENDDLGADGTRDLIAGAMSIAPLKEGGAFYVFAPPGDAEMAFRLGLIAAGLPMRHSCVWVKDRFAFGRADYHYRHESVLYGWRAGAGHYFVNERTHDTVWEVAQPKVSKEHPTMKPVEIVARPIRNSSRPEEVVYDPFGGSGTTLVACEQEGRVGVTVELDPRYADVILARFASYAGIEPELVAEVPVA